MAWVREFARYAHLVPRFAFRDVRARYKQTVFGVAWAVIQPFSLMLVFTLVFGTFARVRTDAPYPIFAYSTLIFWAFFATTFQQGTMALTANSPLVRKIYFPRETLLLAVFVSAAVDLGVALVLLLGLMAYYHVALTLTALWAIPILALQVTFTLGLVCASSAIHARYRDVGHGLPLLTQLWLFGTPVAYPLSLVPASLLPVYLLNPMVGVMDGYRRVLLEGRPPDLALLGWTAALAVGLLAVTFPLFKHAERTFADVI